MTSARLLALVLAATCSRLAAQVPQLSATLALPTPALAPGGGSVSIDLRNHFGFPGVSGPVVQFDTSLGRFNVELRSDAAPRHAANFLAYVQAGTYAGTFIHRSAALDGSGISIVQGGGYRSTGGSNVSAVAKLAPVALEYALPNARGTLAAARTSDLNSATSEWYFNVKDNSTILGPANGGGYSVGELCPHQWRHPGDPLPGRERHRGASLHRREQQSGGRGGDGDRHHPDPRGGPARDRGGHRDGQ